MPDVLDDIVAETRRRVQTQKQRIPFRDLEQQAREGKPVIPFSAALRQKDRIAIIAELKQASPSAGVIRQEKDLAERVMAYTRGGAAALSILTEERYFGGSLDILRLARKASRLPLLRKDFIIDPYQVAESRQIRADAILLITCILEDGQLNELLSQARELGLESLVETHSEKDVERALKCGAALIGINHRDLRTLEMDMNRARKLLPIIPRGAATVVVESGIRTPDEARSFLQWGAHAVLIGETFMRDPDPESIVRRFADTTH